MAQRSLIPVASVALLLLASTAWSAESTGSRVLPSGPSTLCGEPKEDGKDKVPNPSALCGEPKEDGKDKVPNPS